MKTLALISILSTFLSLCAASPAPESNADGAKHMKHKKFTLRAKSVPPGGNYDGFYLDPFHTQAGFNFAGFVNRSTGISKSYLDNGKLLFDYGAGTPYPMEFLNDELSTSWGAVLINVVQGGKLHEPYAYNGFAIDEKGHLTQGNPSDFKKINLPYWRICLWNHGYPELFFSIPYNYDNGHVKLLTSNCEFAELEVVYV